MFGLNVQVLRYVLATAVAAAIVAIAGIAIVLVLRGGVEPSASAVVGLVAYIATLVTLLGTLLGVGVVAQQQHDQGQLLNGHIQEHMTQGTPLDLSPPSHAQQAQGATPGPGGENTP